MTKSKLTVSALMRAADPLYTTSPEVRPSSVDLSAIFAATPDPKQRSSGARPIAVVGAAVLALIVASVTVLLIHSHPGRQRTPVLLPTPAAPTVPCDQQLRLVSVNPLRFAPVITLVYDGSVPCRVDARAPDILLVGADGTSYGGPADVPPSLRPLYQRLTATPPRFATLQPGDRMTITIRALLNCRTVKEQPYVLHLYFGRPAVLDPRSGVPVPLGVQVGTSTMCLTYGIGDPTYPLISSLLNTATYRLTTQTLSATGPVKVLTQTMLGRSVTFWALNSSAIGPRQRATTADGAPLTTNIGLSTAISIGAGRGRPAIAGTPGPHGDPRTIPRLALGASAPSPGFEARVIMGVTTGDAHSVEVQLGGLTLDPILRTNPVFPGLSFFMFSDGPQDRIDTITVLSATNDVIAQADPTTIPNP